MNVQAAVYDNKDAALEVRNRQITAVHTISRELSKTLDLDERLNHILSVSIDTVKASGGTIYLYRANDDKLVFRNVFGEKARELTGMAISAHVGVCGAVFQSGTPEITNRPQETSTHSQDIDKKTGFSTHNIVTVPLMYRAGKPVGVMQVINKIRGDFDDNDLEVLEIIGSLAATAIENAELARNSELAAVAHAVGDLSHDIKNKVTPISMSVDTLAPMTANMYADLDRICGQLTDAQADDLRSSTSFLKDFYFESFQIIKDQVQDIQDYTKLIADALHGVVSEPAMDPTQLNPIVRKQVASLEPIARKRDVKLHCELAGSPVFKLDRFLLERAIYNLVNNAIPETPAGGSITVKTIVMEEGTFPNGRCICIEVTDTGRGMPPHVLERILRGDAKSTKPGGTGLGTRIVYNAVASHKGVFEGESKEGVGTTFRMKLPYST